MRVPEQGTTGFQDERELVNFLLGTGSAATASLGLSGAGMFRRLDAQVTLANDTTTQSVFGASKGQFTVEAGKAYAFDGVIILGTGNTTHLTGFGFTLVTAVLANYRANVISSNAADDIAAAATLINLESATITSANLTGTGVETSLIVSGTFEVTTAGTVQPVINFSAAPGGTNTVEVGTRFSLRPIGLATVFKFGSVT